MSDTRHLDTAIRILGGGALKTRKHQAVEVTVHISEDTSWYLVQVGNRVVEEGAGDRASAEAAGQRKADALKAKGMRAVLVVY